jgi:hypothetical protein
MDTPLAPIPASDEPRRRARRSARAPAGETGLRAALRAGLRHAWRARRVLLVVMLVHLGLGLTVVQPMQTRLAARLDSHAHAPALAGAPDELDRRSSAWQAGGLDAGLWRDVKHLEKSLFDTQAISLFWVALVAWLFGAVVAGGHLGTSAAPGRIRVGAFFEAGGTWFGRMLRVGLVFGLLYYVIGRIVIEMWGGVASVGEQSLPDSSHGWWGEWMRAAVVTVFFLWLRVAADLGRADIVLHDRRSALGAVFRGLGRTFAHPVRTIGLALSLGVPEVLLIIGIGLLVGVIGSGSTLSLGLSFLFIQLAVLLRLAARGALLAGNHQLLGSASA